MLVAGSCGGRQVVLKNQAAAASFFHYAQMFICNSNVGAVSGPLGCDGLAPLRLRSGQRNVPGKLRRRSARPAEGDSFQDRVGGVCRWEFGYFYHECGWVREAEPDQDDGCERALSADFAGWGEDLF